MATLPAGVKSEIKLQSDSLAGKQANNRVDSAAYGAVRARGRERHAFYRRQRLRSSQDQEREIQQMRDDVKKMLKAASFFLDFKLFPRREKNFPNWEKNCTFHFSLACKKFFQL